MIETRSYIGIGIMTAGGIIVPLAACIWWLKRSRDRFTTVLVGALTWFLFAMIIERIPLLLLLGPSSSVKDAIMGSAVLYTAVGASLAGIFEETGRFVAFSTLLKDRKNRETAISHGIGHGGFESLFMLGISGIQNLVYARMIDSGAFQGIVDQASAAGADVSALASLPAQIMAITPVTGLLGTAERIFAMLLHVGLSIMVFCAVRDSKKHLFVLAILLHALFDVPAALYQAGIVSLYLVEALLAAYAAIFFAVVYRVLYRKAQ